MANPTNAADVGMDGILNSVPANTRDTKLGYSNGDAVDNSEGNNPVNGSGDETRVNATIGSKNAVFINAPSTGAIYPNS